MGRTKFSQHEIDIIAMLLRKKNAGTRFQQKEIRHQLRVNFEFNISDFNEQGKAFGDVELQEAIKRGAIVILDDATIANMKAKLIENWKLKIDNWKLKQQLQFKNKLELELYLCYIAAFISFYIQDKTVCSLCQIHYDSNKTSQRNCHKNLYA